MRDWGAPVAQIEALKQAGCDVQYRSPIRPRQSWLIEKTRHVIDRWQQSQGNNQYAWLDRFRPDLLVISNGCQRDGLDWMSQCRRRGIPYSLIVQAADDRFPIDDTLAAELRPAYEQAVKCYFVSVANQEFVRRQLVSVLSNSTVVRNPFNVSYDASPLWPPEDGITRLACVARLDLFTKGQDVLFDVLRAQHWRERSIRLTLFGDGPNRQTLVALRAMDSLDHVTFGGFTPDVESIWRSHQALVLPSRAEGLPLAIVEAMLCGRVCIVTDVGGNAELIEDNASGFAAAAPTRNCLDEAMERAWSRRSEWANIGQLAARRVREQVPRDPAKVFSDELLCQLNNREQPQVIRIGVPIESDRR